MTRAPSPALRRSILPILAALSGLVAADPAAASGNLSCKAEDRSVSFEAGSGVSRGLGGALFQFKAELRLKPKGIAPDLAATAFAQEHVAHSWVVGGEARLLLYREREGSAPHGYVEITVLTRAKPGEHDAAGTYAVTVYDTTNAKDGTGETRTFKGRATCFLGE